MTSEQTETEPNPFKVLFDRLAGDDKNKSTATETKNKSNEKTIHEQRGKLGAEETQTNVDKPQTHPPELLRQQEINVTDYNDFRKGKMEKDFIDKTSSQCPNELYEKHERQYDEERNKLIGRFEEEFFKEKERLKTQHEQELQKELAECHKNEYQKEKANLKQEYEQELQERLNNLRLKHVRECEQSLHQTKSKYDIDYEQAKAELKEKHLREYQKAKEELARKHEMNYEQKDREKDPEKIHEKNDSQIDKDKENIKNEQEQKLAQEIAATQVNYPNRFEQDREKNDTTAVIMAETGHKPIQDQEKLRAQPGGPNKSTNESATKSKDTSSSGTEIENERQT